MAIVPFCQNELKSYYILFDYKGFPDAKHTSDAKLSERI